ncbi:MAG TPA: 5'-nucleotidase C-terminal domain-containing protein [bacterium]|nr:5'-nucleotidase C-terminal domain-containing protein [bacterium]
MQRIVRTLWPTLLALALLAAGLGCHGQNSSSEQAAPIAAERAGESATAAPINLTILFFNDLHGHLMPFTVKKDDGSRAEVGGIARIAALANMIRAENEKKGAKTLTLVAGDILQGTPMSTVFHGRPDVEALNMMGVGAMTVGNHEFDFGLDNFLARKDQAKFPFISSNIVWRDTGKLVCAPSASFPLGPGLELTVIGATTMQLLYTTKPENVEKLNVIDTVKSVKHEYDKAGAKGPVLLLSHNRAADDEAIARAVPGLIAVIGGHDQILLTPKKMVGDVPVFQAFEKGKYLGRAEFAIDPATKKAALLDWSYIAITAELAEDPAVAKMIETYRSQLDARFKEVIGASAVFMDGERERIRYEETNLGDFAADIMREHTGAQVALLNAGSLRASIDEGPVTVETVFKVMPYENEVVKIVLSGGEIKSVLARAVMGTRADEDGGFLHVSGLSFKIRGKTPEDIMIGGAPLDPAKTYSVAITDFMAAGGDGYKIFTARPALKTGSPLRELIVDTIRSRGTVDAKKDGRITRMAD